MLNNNYSAVEDIIVIMYYKYIVLSQKLRVEDLKPEKEKFSCKSLWSPDKLVQFQIADLGNCNALYSNLSIILYQVDVPKSSQLYVNEYKNL